MLLNCYADFVVAFWAAVALVFCVCSFYGFALVFFVFFWVVTFYVKDYAEFSFSFSFHFDSPFLRFFTFGYLCGFLFVPLLVCFICVFGGFWGSEGFR